MKKKFFISVLVLGTILAVSCDMKTNYSDEGHTGHIIIHNDAASGNSITNITITSIPHLNTPTEYYNENVTVAPGGQSRIYQLELHHDDTFSMGGWNGYRVYISAGGAQPWVNVYSYEDIDNHLYYDGANLAERN